jgi:hypothetical protein
MVAVTMETTASTGTTGTAVALRDGLERHGSEHALVLGFCGTRGIFRGVPQDMMKYREGQRD